MRVGTLEVQLVSDDGPLLELVTGHVQATPGQVYALQITNHGPRVGVCDVHVDGRLLSEQGLVVRPGQTVRLERPVNAGEHGRFTVFAEGTTAVFGEDGGRENPDLGLIKVSQRLEVARTHWVNVLNSPNFDHPGLVPPTPTPRRPIGSPFIAPWHNGMGGPYLRGGLAAPTEGWGNDRVLGGPPAPASGMEFYSGPSVSTRDGGLISNMVTTGNPALRRASTRGRVTPAAMTPIEAPAESPTVTEQDLGTTPLRAAGTGLTGRSTQEFLSVSVGALEAHADVVELRLVLERPTWDDATPRPLPKGPGRATPARPEPRA